MDTMSAIYTRAHYELLPEGFPAQLIEGQLVQEPAPTFGHQRLALGIAEALKKLVGARRTGIAPVDIQVDEFNVYQPDVVVFRAPLADDERGLDADMPLLVVEVLSPSTASRDRTVKRMRLLDAGVEEVWLIDAANGTVEVYDRERYRDLPRRAVRAEVLASKALVGFRLSPRQLFEA